MDQTIQSRFIPQQLLYFIAGRRCCQQFSCTFRTSDHNVLIGCARSLGLRSQFISSTSNQGCVKVFKQSCKHYLEEPKTLSLSHSSIMDMFTLLSRTTTKDELQMYADKYGQRFAIKIPEMHVPLVELSPPQPRLKTEKYRNFVMGISKYLRHDILKSMYSYRVVVVDTNQSKDKSLLFPIIILQDSEAKQSNLKIIFIEREEISAIYNSERFANLLGESVGETVGIQIPHTSNISSVTHVVYTTAKYFLRSLFKTNANKFDHISHFVVNDVHMNDPYTDILLSELKQSLNHQNLRIILLSQTNDLHRFVAFFEEGTEYRTTPLKLKDDHISYLKDIQSSIALAGIEKVPKMYRDKPQMFRNKSQRNEQMDKCLEAYQELGTDASICPFLYSINYDLVPVNYQHSLTGKTALLIATHLSNTNHIRLLLFMGANPYVADEQHENAITIAAIKANMECIEIFNNHVNHGYVAKSAKPEFVEYDIIINILYLLSSKPDSASGNILIILPTYYHIVKLNYMLLSHFLTGNLKTFSICILHENMEKEYLDALVNASADTDTLKIVLATAIIESLTLPISFKYLIDTACRKKVLYDGMSNSTEDRYEWVSKDCLLRRQLILAVEGASDWHCFLLISKNTLKMLRETSIPIMQTMHLDQICLTVKLLSPNTVISEYLSYTISPPPLINVHHTVQFLKKIDVLDESEEVTWLGCRLIDLPVSCQLGRILVFGILLQCLDPILTIVSSMSTSDPLNIPFNEDIDQLWDKFTIYIQNCIKSERVRLAEQQLSDHFIYVRLFQEWQSRLKSNISPLYLSDEYDFMLNGLMEQLNCTRSRIVSALRAANLVHNQGALGIQNVNTKSFNWSLVKAALTGGMYPNICAVDPKKNCLKSATSVNVHMHPNSVLRGFGQPFCMSTQNICSQWIVCSREKNSVKHATVVVPLAVAMFTGSSKLGLGQIIESQSPSSNNASVHFFIDEWIWMIVSKSDFELVMKTRQHFFRIYQYLLKFCADPDKWRNDSRIVTQHTQLLNTLSSVFQNEDTAAGFKDCLNIGLRPSIKLPNLYLLSVNSHFIWNQQKDEAEAKLKVNSNSIERNYFLLYTETNPGNVYQNSDAKMIESVLGKFARPIDSPKRHIYVILYSKNPDMMLSISRAKIQKDEFILKEYFRNKVPVNEIVEPCAALNVNVPSFDGRLTASLIDKRVGNLIMELFAFRHRWIHKY